MTAARQRLAGSGQGRTQLLLALVVRPLTTHPFGGGALSLLLIETSNILALNTLFPYITYYFSADRIPFLFRRLWPPSIS